MIDGIIYVFAIRLFLPLLILKWPLHGFIAALLGDAFGDAILLDLIGSGFGESYHAVDKLLDFYMFTVAVIASLRFKVLEKHISIALYAIRTIGILLFEFTQIRLVLVLFPNVFEFFFLFVAGTKKFLPQFKLTKKNAPIVLIALAIPKLLQELLLHQLGFDKLLWDFWLRIKVLLV